MNRKKITSLIAVMLLLTIGFFGKSCCRCTGVDFYETQWQTRQFQIASIDWLISDCETFWFAVRTFPELSPFVISDGAVLGFLVLDDGARAPLPDTWTRVIVFEDGSEYVFSETYSFNVSPREIVFTSQASDAVMERPPTQRFHMVLIW